MLTFVKLKLGDGNETVFCVCDPPACVPLRFAGRSYVETSLSFGRGPAYREVCGHGPCVPTLACISCPAGAALAAAESQVGQWLCRLAAHFPSENIMRSKAGHSVCLCPSVFCICDSPCHDHLSAILPAHISHFSAVHS